MGRGGEERGGEGRGGEGRGEEGERVESKTWAEREGNGNFAAYSKLNAMQ